MTPYFTNDAIVLGILIAILALVHGTAASRIPFWRQFYRVVPPLLLCYFLPALCHQPLGLISGEHSQLYFIASRYFLPASLILLCLSIDLKGVLQLGPKAITMFVTATVGIVLGGPLALLAVSLTFPQWLGADSDQLWRALSTVAGSWIGGGANQTAMKEVYGVSDQIFATMVLVDVLVANVWMGMLLYGTGIRSRIDRWLKADTSAIDTLEARVADYQAQVRRYPDLSSILIMLAVAFSGVALAHWGSESIVPVMERHAETLRAFHLHALTSTFFWLVVIATTFGLALSFTPARGLEGVGASTWGSLFLYLLVATIGMKINLWELGGNLGLFAVGFLWIGIHAILLLVMAKLIQAPFFFVAVGSQANVGGAASAPVVASAFSPSLAPVGVLMAVLGYALGTYGAILCAQLMELATGVLR